MLAPTLRVCRVGAMTLHIEPNSDYIELTPSAPLVRVLKEAIGCLHEEYYGTATWLLTTLVERIEQEKL